MRILTTVIVFGLIVLITGCEPKATQRTITDNNTTSSDDMKQVDTQPASVESVEKTKPAESSSVTASPPDKSAEPVTQSTPAPVTPAKRIYTVHKGDTLWSIAVQYYGDGQRYRDIIKANPGLEPTKMYVGQQIILP